MAELDGPILRPPEFSASKPLNVYPMFSTFAIHSVSLITDFVLPLDCFGPRSERPPSPDADSLLSHSSQFNSTLDR